MTFCKVGGRGLNVAEIEEEVKCLCDSRAVVCLVELSRIMEVFSICAVQFSATGHIRLLIM